MCLITASLAQYQRRKIDNFKVSDLILYEYTHSVASKHVLKHTTLSFKFQRFFYFRNTAILKIGSRNQTISWLQ